MHALRSFFLVGIYPIDTPLDEERWSTHAETCKYLSKKYRICTYKSAAEFFNPEDARNFFHEWKRRNEYKLKIVEYKTHVDIEVPKPEVGSPREILEQIRTFETSFVHSTAFMWFIGQDISKMWSASTIQKHQKILAKYNLSLSLPPKQLLEPLPSLDDNEWHLKKGFLKNSSD